MDRGRPKDKLEDRLQEGWEAKVLELASQGGSEVEIRDLLDIGNTVFYRWMEEEPHFRETIKKASQKCQVWWEKNGRVNLDSKEFNSTLWYMNMKNRFGWADKKEIKQDIEAEVKTKINPEALTDEQLRVVAEIQRQSGIS